MNQSLLSEFGDPVARVEAALSALRAGGGVLVADDEDRENEGDLIFAAQSMTNEQMALMIRECSGIVCLCLTDERVRQLELPFFTMPLYLAFSPKYCQENPERCQSIWQHLATQRQAYEAAQAGAVSAQ